MRLLRSGLEDGREEIVRQVDAEPSEAVDRPRRRGTQPLDRTGEVGLEDVPAPHGEAQVETVVDGLPRRVTRHVWDAQHNAPLREDSGFTELRETDAYSIRADAFAVVSQRPL